MDYPIKIAVYVIVAILGLIGISQVLTYGKTTECAVDIFNETNITKLELYLSEAKSTTQHAKVSDSLLPTVVPGDEKVQGMGTALEMCIPLLQQRIQELKTQQAQSSR